MKVEMNITQEKDEKLLEIGEEDDDVGKKAEGEEGKFGDPDKDPTLESKVPRRDGQMVSKIDPKKIGRPLHGAEVIAPEALGGFAGIHLVAAVGAKGVRALIREHLTQKGWIEVEQFSCIG